MNRDFGTLVARSAIGLPFAAHGAQKAFGLFDGPGPEGAGNFLEGLGFKPGRAFAALTAYTEIASGLLMTLGLGGPLAPAAILGVMTVAALTVHGKNGFFAQKGGIELNVLYGAAAVAFAMRGYGRLSLDAAFGLDKTLDDERLAWLAVLGGPLAGVLVASQRSAPPPQA